MQYATSTPALVQLATVPAAPKSTSSGCAITTRTRSIDSSVTVRRPYPSASWLASVASRWFDGTRQRGAERGQVRVNVRLRLAGPLEVVADDRCVHAADFPGRQGRLVFAALVLAHRPVD